MLDIITKNYIFKLTLLRQVPILICVCLVQVCQTAGPQFTCGSFGFFGSHHVKLSVKCVLPKDYILQIEMFSSIRWQNWLSVWEEEFFCSRIHNSIMCLICLKMVIKASFVLASGTFSTSLLREPRLSNVGDWLKFQATCVHHPVPFIACMPGCHLNF